MATAAETIEIYNNVLQRDPTDAELAAFVAASQTSEGEAVQIDLLVNSGEAQDDVWPFLRIYQAIFGRVPDAAGLNFWVDAMRSGLTLQTIVEGDAAAGIAGFKNSAEFVAEYGADVDPTDEAFITALYQNLLGRAPDQAGLDFFTSLPDSATVGDVVTAFTESPEFSDAINAQIRIFLDAAAQGTQDYEGSVYDINDDGVVNEDDDPSDVIDNIITLTDAIGENVVGSSGNDEIRAVLGTTFQVSDTIDGSGGSDTFNLTVTADADLPAGATVTGVETINLIGNAAGGQVTNLSASAFVGATAIWQINDANAIGGLSASQTAGFRNVDATATATFTGASASVALDNVATASALDIAGTAVTSLSISGSVDDDGATPAGPGALTITDSSTSGTAGANGITSVTGSFSSDVELNIVDFTAATSVDLSGSTGDIGDTGAATALDALVELETFVSGSGSDTLTAAISDEADTSFDLGAGNDAFSLNGTGDTANSLTTVTLGEGNDTFVVATALTNVAAAATFEEGLIEIADFNAAEDVLDVQALGARDVLTNTELANISGAADLETALGLAATATTEGGYSVFNFGGDAYILNNLNGDADALTNLFENGDGLIKVTGMSVAEINEGVNFIA